MIDLTTSHRADAWHETGSGLRGTTRIGRPGSGDARPSGEPCPQAPRPRPGARSGEPREAVLTFTRDGDRYVVAGTAGGSPTTPAWVHNLVAEPMVKVEAKGRSFRARAIVVDEAERQRLWDAHVAERPEFADYPRSPVASFP